MSPLYVRENRGMTRPDERPRPCRGSEQVAFELNAPVIPPYLHRTSWWEREPDSLRREKGDPLSCITFFRRIP